MFVFVKSSSKTVYSAISFLKEKKIASNQTLMVINMANVSAPLPFYIKRFGSYDPIRQDAWVRTPISRNRRQSVSTLDPVR